MSPFCAPTCNWCCRRSRFICLCCDWEKRGRMRITSDVRALKTQPFPGNINIKVIGHLADAAFGSCLNQPKPCCKPATSDVRTKGTCLGLVRSAGAADSVWLHSAPCHSWSTGVTPHIWGDTPTSCASDATPPRLYTRHRAPLMVDPHSQPSLCAAESDVSAGSCLKKLASRCDFISVDQSQSFWQIASRVGDTGVVTNNKADGYEMRWLVFPFMSGSTACPSKHKTNGVAENYPCFEVKSDDCQLRHQEALSWRSETRFDCDLGCKFPATHQGPLR